MDLDKYETIYGKTIVRLPRLPITHEQTHTDAHPNARTHTQTKSPTAQVDQILDRLL